jgi:ribosome-associated protein
MAQELSLIERVHLCARAAADKRGSDMVVLEVSEMTSYADYVLVMSGSSDRRVRTIADGIRQEMKEAGYPALGVEGHKEGRWILLDFGPVIVHVFFEEIRPMFDLEGLWSDAKRIELPEEVTKPGTLEIEEEEEW